MKEFMHKHPILTYMLAGSAIKGVVTIVKVVAYAITGKDKILEDSINISVNSPKSEDQEEETT